MSERCSTESVSAGICGTLTTGCEGVKFGEVEDEGDGSSDMKEDEGDGPSDIKDEEGAAVFVQSNGFCACRTKDEEDG